MNLYFFIVKWRDAGVVQRGRLKIYCVKSRVSSNLTLATIHLSKMLKVFVIYNYIFLVPSDI